MAAAMLDVDELEPLTDAEMDALAIYYAAVNAEAADEADHQARERARIEARDALIVINLDHEPF
jgi:cytochrome c553